MEFHHSSSNSNILQQNAAFYTAFIYFIMLLAFHLFHHYYTQLIGVFYGSAVIKDWTLSAPYSHLAGGMKYKDGKLTVPIPGRYYIYQQIYWRGYRGKPIRISILLNNKVIAKGRVYDFHRWSVLS